MSMSQEEIEALMNGLDIADSDDGDEDTADSSSSNDSMSEDDIESLIAQTTSSSSSFDEDESVDDLLASLGESEPQESADEDNFDDILAGIDGMVDNTPATEEPEPVVKAAAPAKATTSSKSEPQKAKSDFDEESIARNWTDSKINEGVFPLPVEKNHKVVNQLSEVANDSEEKASKIFDVLSFILDENNLVERNAKDLDGFLDKQILLLSSLTKKFPNIEAFRVNLEHAQAMKIKPKEIIEKVNSENNQLFEAMELMQFHDINRQKIERVMTVIRKLSSYLNNLFEDDNSHPDVAVAKHIHGDVNSELVGNEDLDALIAEFGN